MVASFIQANFAGLASLLPNQIMHLMVTGQAMSGLFAVAAQILSLAGNWSIVESTFAYFIFADLILLGTLFIYFITTKTVSLHVYMLFRSFSHIYFVGVLSVLQLAYHFGIIDS